MISLRNHPFIIIGLALCFTGTLTAKKRIHSTPPEQRLHWYDQHVEMIARSPFRNLPWQFVGPTNISGRMTDVDVVTPKGEEYTTYVAGASGGVWKTVNEGVTWEPIFEHAASTSIGDIAIDPTDQNIVWIGGGEANIFRSSQAGSGVYRSVDAGETWEYKGLAGTHTIARVVVHPQNSNIVYIAASGHEWTDNKERGVYKTTDGGESWEKILYIDEKTGAIDLVMAPDDPNTLYASTWQRIRHKWNDPRNEADYTGSGIHKSTDGGRTWTPINEGLPEAQYRGRIGIDICRSHPDILYAFVDNYESTGKGYAERDDAYGTPEGDKIKGATVYRSYDRGESWVQVSETGEYMEGLSSTYGWVFGQIRVDPNDPDVIYVMGLALHKSIDGGKTYKALRGMHGDHHGLWIDPANSDYLVNVNDGGVAISYDGGDNWRTFYDNLPLVQFFNVNVDMDTPFRVYGSVQDHGSYRGIVDLSRGRNCIPAVEFEDAPGGEGSNHTIDPTNPDIVYSAGFYGRINRTNMSSGERESILPELDIEGVKLRGQWVAPFILSPHNPRILYHGMQYLFRSLDQGNTWERLTDDMTYNNPEKLGDIPYQTIFAIAESPLKFGVIYVGTDDGKVHVTRDGGRSWKKIMKGLPYQKWVSRIVASAYDEGTVYMSQNGKRDDDFTPYLWKSSDFGNTWVDISSGIPYGPVNVIREDPVNKDVLYVGTDLGVYVSIDGGNSWNTLTGELPTTFVLDLIVHPTEDILVAATHGRGIWAMDVRYIQQLNEPVLSQTAYIYAIEPARLPRSTARWAINTKRDASFGFYLKEDGPVDLTILDENREKVQAFEQEGIAGLNFVDWELKKQASEDADTEYVEAGLYTVRLIVGGSILEKSFKVNPFKK